MHVYVKKGLANLSTTEWLPEEMEKQAKITGKEIKSRCEAMKKEKEKKRLTDKFPLIWIVHLRTVTVKCGNYLRKLIEMF